MEGRQPRMSAEKATTLKAAAVAGLAPRRAARPHHSRNPTRWARPGAKMAMSRGMPASVMEPSIPDPAVTSSSDAPKP